MKTIKIEILEKITSEIKSEMEKIHFISDLHAHHPKIIGIHNRPTTPEDHERWLLEEVYNKYIGKKDQVYLLGDISLGKKTLAENFVSKLNGVKHLISGNHDKNILSLGNFKDVKQIKNFNFSRGELNIHIVLSHFPIAKWEREEHGSWHLYGHCHGTFINNGYSWDVGIDNKNALMGLDKIVHHNMYKPLNLYDVCQIMARKEYLKRYDYMGLDDE